MNELVKFKKRQKVFLILSTISLIGVWFIPNFALCVSSIVILYCFTIAFIISNFEVEKKSGKGLYLNNPPKEVYTIKGSYWVKILKTSSTDKYDIHILSMGLFTWKYEFYKRMIIDPIHTGEYTDEILNKSISNVIESYEKEELIKRSFSIEKDFRKWNGILGSESDIKFLNRENRLDNILSKEVDIEK